MNFTKLLTEILSSGISQASVARAVGLSPPSIIDIRAGRQKTVKWDVGQQIIKLHAERCLKEPVNAD